MGIRKITLEINEHYHNYNRGNGKNCIFKDKEDYERFIKLLYISNSEKSFNFRNSIVEQKIDAWDFDCGEPIVNVLAWVLMPNHFHILLISPRSDLGGTYNPITEYMRKVSTAYVMYFNKKYARTGGLFEGKFKSSHIGKDNYFQYLFSYIHLNPLKLFQHNWKEKALEDPEAAIEFLKNYKYSSLMDYSVERKEGKILHKESLPESFRFSHIKELFEWIRSEFP